MLHVPRHMAISWLSFVLWTSVSFQIIAQNEIDDNSPKGLFDSIDHLTIGRSLLAAVAIVLGAVFTFAGYRLFRPTMFATAFLVGGLFVAGVVQAIFEGRSSVTLATWISFFVGGFLIACTVICLYKVGVFLIGAAGGILLAGSLNNSFGYRISSSNPTLVFIILAVVLGIVGGLLLLRAERTILIIVTAFVGSQTLVWGIGYFLGKYPNPVDLKHLAKTLDDGVRVYHISKSWWAYVAAMVVLFVLGAYVQFRRNKNGKTYHRTSARAVGKNSDNQTAPQGTPVYQAAETPQYGNPVRHV